MKHVSNWKKSVGFAGVVCVVLAGGAHRAARAAQLPAPELVSVPSDALFAPPGFDSNDNAQVVVHGEMPNTCYKAAPTQSSLDVARKTVTVKPQAYVRSGCWCADVRVPFTQAIDLGPLEAGKYRVVEIDDQKRVLRETSLTIEGAEASAATDNLLYAPVKNAVLTQSATGNQLVLSGAFPSSCMELQQVKVLHRDPRILEVLPIALYRPGTNCAPASQTFETRIDLPTMPEGQSLIHVRLLNGQALNSVERL